MQILQVVDSLRVGGAQRLMLTFAGQARAHQAKATILSLSEFSGGMALAPDLRALGAEVVVFPAPNLFTLSRIFSVAKFVKENRFTVIHSHLTYANIISGIVGKILRIPVVATLHSTAVDKRHAHVLRDGLEKYFLKTAKCVIGVGEGVAEKYRATLKREIVVLPNAVDENPGLLREKRIELRKSMVREDTRRILISVGRLSPDKGVSDLLKAFQIVTEEFSDVSLVMVGDGDLRDELAQQAISLGIADNVFWLGMRNDVADLLAASDLYVSASHREGLSLSLLEAMMAGLPLVVTDVGEAGSLVGNNAGFVVPAKEPDRLADAVLQVLTRSDCGQALGQAGLERARAKYGAEQWFDRLMKIYDEVKLDSREQADVRV